MADYIERETILRKLRVDCLAHYPSYCIIGILSAANEVANIPGADVRPVVRGKWEKVGEQMLINLENAREQYAELGYPHRKILNLRCSSCRKVTMVDSSIAYDFCPHCGANMREERDGKTVVP